MKLRRPGARIALPVLLRTVSSRMSLRSGGRMAQLGIVLVAAVLLAVRADVALGCGVCGCCRVDAYKDPIDPYIYGENPLATGKYEVAQTAPVPGGSGSTITPIEPGSWTLAIMPDTQIYAQSYPQHFNAQTQFLKDNAAALNLKYMLHEGDIVNIANQTNQWTNARTALNTLNGFVPYALAPGNHDYGGEGDDRTTYFDDGAPTRNYFGKGTPYAAQTSIGGFYEGDGTHKTDNSWHTFSANGEDWIVFAMEWGPRDAVVQWADQVLTAHPNHNAILVTHAYMYYDDTIYDWATKSSGQSWNPHSYGIQNLPGGVNDGQELWDKFVKKHDNFKFVFNGHVLSDGAGKRATLGNNGNVVHQILANYQMNVEGGQGDMRLLEFKPDGETVVVRTYSPVLDRYNMSSQQQFTLNMNSTVYSTVPIGHAAAGNLVAAGPTDPAANTVDSVTVPQFSSPGVGTGQLNRGDFQPTIGGGQVTYQEGIMLASISENQRADFVHAAPFAGVSRRASVEPGRNPYGDGNISLSVMEAGNIPAASQNEVNFNTSVSWFPFNSGFRGAHVNGVSGTLATGAFNGVAQSMVTKTGTGRYSVNLGVNSQTDGMLFTTGNTNNDLVVQTGPAANGSNWDVRVQRNSSNFSATGTDTVLTASGGDNAAHWSFLYLSYQTPGLVGGYFNGASGANIQSAGSFTMSRTSAGQYQLTIPGESPQTGMLLLSVANQVTISAVTAPDDNFLTYGTGPGSSFLINSFDIVTGAPVAFEDTKFVWAFVSFTNPLQPYVMPGDYNRDALVDNFDYDVWRSQYGKTGALTADGNGDGVVDSADYVYWRNNKTSGPGAGAAVPEPASICYIVCIGLLIMGRGVRTGRPS